MAYAVVHAKVFLMTGQFWNLSELNWVSCKLVNTVKAVINSMTSVVVIVLTVGIFKETEMDVSILATALLSLDSTIVTFLTLVDIFRANYQELPNVVCSLIRHLELY